jgi:glutaredoxin
MDKLLILYTMKGCPFCVMMKDKLNESNLNFHERDIDDHKDEYDLFVEVTENDFVPAFMIIENSGTNEPITSLYAPDRDFNDLDEGLEIIKNKMIL